MAGAKLPPKHLTAAELVSRCNALTAIAGLAVKVSRFEEAIAVLSSTSLFVACCEALLGRKLEGVKRKPSTVQERAENVQAVLWELSNTVLQTDLSHISSQGVVSRDPVDVYNLLEIMSALMTQDNQHGSKDDNDRIPAAHHSLNGPGHMQQGGKTAEYGRTNRALLATPSTLQSFNSNLCSSCCSELPVEVPVPSPASVRPKQRAAPDAGQLVADDTTSSSQCSQSLDAFQPDVFIDTADQPQQQSRRTIKTCRKAAGSKRKVHTKRQAKKVPLVMSGSYAAAVYPVLEQPDVQKMVEASDRQDTGCRDSEGSEQRLRGALGRGPLVDPTMTAKLAHLYSLSQDDPKSRQQRQRYEAAKQQAEQQRVALQKQAWLKQSLAHRRLEASRQQQQLLLTSRARAFHAKVDAIRAAQQDAAAAAAEESQRLRRLAAQEARLKHTFFDAVEAEKERLLLARGRERERGIQEKPVPQGCSVQVRGQAQRGAEGWLDVLRQHCADLEVGLAQEHQHRVRQEREKALMQQAFRQDAIRREWEQHEAQLVRVATLDDAALFCSTHSAKQHQTLKHQFRHSIRMSA